MQKLFRLMLKYCFYISFAINNETNYELCWNCAQRKTGTKDEIEDCVNFSLMFFASAMNHNTLSVKMAEIYDGRKTNDTYASMSKANYYGMHVHVCK